MVYCGAENPPRGARRGSRAARGGDRPQDTRTAPDFWLRPAGADLGRQALGLRQKFWKRHHFGGQALGLSRKSSDVRVAWAGHPRAAGQKLFFLWLELLLFFSANAQRATRNGYAPAGPPSWGNGRRQT